MPVEDTLGLACKALGARSGLDNARPLYLLLNFILEIFYLACGILRAWTNQPPIPYKGKRLLRHRRHCARSSEPRPTEERTPSQRRHAWSSARRSGVPAALPPDRKAHA